MEREDIELERIVRDTRRAKVSIVFGTILVIACALYLVAVNVMLRHENAQLERGVEYLMKDCYLSPELRK